MDTSPARTEETQLRLPSHLKGLEAESIEIMREVVAESKKPVMLYSIGKDSSVMLHLAIKAFYPAKLPFPLLHVDTSWKFREMIAFATTPPVVSESICWFISTRTVSHAGSGRSRRALPFIPR